MAICKYCKKEIHWIRTVREKPMPVEAEPVPQVMVKLKDKDRYYLAKEVYLPHHTNCEGLQNRQEPDPNDPRNRQGTGFIEEPTDDQIPF